MMPGWRQRSGASATEYALLLVGIALTTTVGVGLTGGRVGDAIRGLFAASANSLAGVDSGLPKRASRPGQLGHKGLALESKQTLWRAMQKALAASERTAIPSELRSVARSKDRHPMYPVQYDGWSSRPVSTGYQNPDAVEVEVTLEGEVQAPVDQIFQAPLKLAQFAMSDLRRREKGAPRIYLENLGDGHHEDMVEWWLDGGWKSAFQALLLPRERWSELRRFRIRGVNAVVPGAWPDGRYSARRNPLQGFTARVPLNPFTAFDNPQAGYCAIDPGNDIELEKGNLWYFWNPRRGGCQYPTQNLKVAIDHLVQPEEQPGKPDWPRLLDDGQLSVVAIYGQRHLEVALSDADEGVQMHDRMCQSLIDQGFAERPATVGRRFEGRVGETAVRVDVLHPSEFQHLTDREHLQNLQQAVREHELVAYFGHSMFGSAGAWAEMDYPDFYQVFFVDGCLSWEHYARSIKRGKGGFDNLDVVTYLDDEFRDANDNMSTFLHTVLWSVQEDRRMNYEEILRTMRRNSNTINFGVSGAPRPASTATGPAGSAASSPPVVQSAELPKTRIIDPRFPFARSGNPEGTRIPDNHPEGLSITYTKKDTMAVPTTEVEVALRHPRPEDLTIRLHHGGRSAQLSGMQGQPDDEHVLKAETDAFSGLDSVGPWTLQIVDHAPGSAGQLLEFGFKFKHRPKP